MKKCKYCGGPVPPTNKLPMFLIGTGYCSGTCEKKAKGL